MKKIFLSLQNSFTDNFMDKYVLIFVLLFCIPVIWSFFVPGYWGVSDDLHIGWMYEMHQAIRILEIPPRFVPDLSYGFGYPLFNFYAPLPFYLGEIFHLLGFTLVGSVKGVFLVSLPLSMYFMYKLLRQFSSGIVSFLGSVVYVYTPYRATDIFVRGAIDEAFVFIFIPLVILSIIKLSNSIKISLRWIGIGGFAFACLVMSHNITAYMLFPFIALLFIINLLYSKNRITSLSNLTIMTFLGFLISAFFWVPALIESKLVKYDTVFNYWDHFPHIKDLITPYFGYGGSNPGSGSGLSFFLGLVNIVVLLIGFISLLKFRALSRNQKPFLIFLLISSLAAIFMMNNRSIFLWRVVPLLPYFQFPWRFLTITTFTSASLVFVIDRLKIPKYVVFFLCIIVVLINFSFFKPHFLGRTDAYYLNRYIPTPVASAEYRKTAEEYLRLPLDTEIRPSNNFPRFYSNGNFIQSIKIDNSLDAEALVNSSKGFQLNYSKYNFPGWNAKIDGSKVQIASFSPYGQIGIVVPPGIHTVSIYYQETKFRMIIDLVSLVSIIAAFCMIKSKKVLEM